MSNSSAPADFRFPSRYFALLSAGVLVALSLGGCASLPVVGGSTENQLVIPEFPSAKEQYGFATLFKDSTIPATDENRRETQVSRLTQCYDEVVQKFPDDLTYTPLARLEMADAARSIGRFKDAQDQYNKVLAGYPENEYVQARALYSIGRTLDSLHDYEEAKTYYRRVHDEYANSSSAAVRDIVKRADRLYYSVRETKVKKRK